MRREMPLNSPVGAEMETIRRRKSGGTGFHGGIGWRRGFVAAGLIAALCACGATSRAQTSSAPGTMAGTVQLATPPANANAGPPATLTLTDALADAQKNSPVFQTAVTAQKMAHEDRVQAKAAMKPQFSYLMQYLNTQGNGISPVGRFVTNDGIHVYRAWGVVKEDMPGSFFIDAGPRRAAAQEAYASANEEIAKRGLVVTVTNAYYGLLVAQRSYGTAQNTLANAQRFLKISQALEKGGEVAHADVIRFQLEVSGAQRNLQDAELAMQQARMNLAVLLFPTFNENFTVVDDLDSAPPLPDFQHAETMAKNNNPDLAAALSIYKTAGVDVAMARAAFFPSLSVELDYGIEANSLALHSRNDTVLQPPGVIQPNLGYFVTYSLSLPIWDWGTHLSQLRQAHDQKNLAQLQLSFAQRLLLNHLYSYYNDADVALNQLTSLRRSMDLAQQNLQLVSLQYQAGEVSVLNVLDAETSLEAARDAYASGEAKYRTALATLQTITGNF